MSKRALKTGTTRLAHVKVEAPQGSAVVGLSSDSTFARCEVEWSDHSVFVLEASLRVPKSDLQTYLAHPFVSATSHDLVVYADFCEGRIATDEDHAP